MGVALALHLLFAVIWVGGLFFSFIILRPSLASLEDHVRVALWAQVLSRFFPWVLAAVPVMLGSGLYMIGLYGGMQGVGRYVHIMLAIGILMMLLFLHTFFSPFRRLKRAVVAGDTALALKQTGMIRVLVGINLVLGVAVLLMASAGKYLLPD